MIRCSLNRLLVFALVVSSGASIVTRSMAADANQNTIDVYDCVVRFSEEVKVPAMESGRVAEVNVQANDTVTEGARIARLDDGTLQIRRREALLRLNSARNEAVDDVELRYAETARDEAKAELEMNQSIQNDVRGAVPMTQMRRLRLAVDRGDLEVALANKRRKQADIEVLLREADLAVIEDELENLKVTSPIDGVVLDVARANNEWIDKGVPIVTVARIDRLHVHALVDGRLISAAICAGLPVSVHWDDPSSGESKSLRGKVLSVDPEILPGERFRLHAEVVNRPDERNPQQWQLKPGADVRMTVYANTSVADRQPMRFK